MVLQAWPEPVVPPPHPLEAPPRQRPGDGHRGAVDRHRPAARLAPPAYRPTPPRVGCAVPPPAPRRPRLPPCPHGHPVAAHVRDLRRPVARLPGLPLAWPGRRPACLGLAVGPRPDCPAVRPERPPADVPDPHVVVQP